MRLLTRRTTLAALALAAAAPLHAAADVSDGVLGYVAIPDLELTLAHADTFAKAVKPDTPPGALRGMLGLSLGDPGLAHVRPGAPLVLLVLKGAAGAAPAYACFVPVTDAKPIESSFATRGWKTRTAAGLLVAAPGDEALAAADGERSSYGAIAASGAHGDARVFVRTDLVMQTYGPILQAGLDMVAAQAATARPKTATPGASPADAARILKVEMRLLTGLLGDAATLRWDLNLEGDAVRSDLALAARPGTGLADFTSMPPPAANPTLGLVGEGGVVNATYQLDPRILAAFVTRMLDSVAQDPDAAALVGPDVQALVRTGLTAATGQVTTSMRATAGAVPGLVTETAAGVGDEAKFMEVLDKGIALVNTGPWAQMYASMGLQVTGSVKRNARVHAGIPVHRVDLAVAAKGAPAEQAALMKQMMKGMDVAFARGFALSSQDAAGLDRMIDRALAAAPAAPTRELRAVTTFGPGRHAYADYDLVGLMHAVLPMLHDKKAGAPMPSVPAAAEPMTFGLTLSGGVLRGEWRMPVRPFVEMMGSMDKPQPATTKVH